MIDISYILILYCIGATITSLYVIVKKANLSDLAIIIMVIFWPIIWLYIIGLLAYKLWFEVFK
jgi:hypothetical protein